MRQNPRRASDDFLIKRMLVGSCNSYYNRLIHPGASHNTSLTFSMSLILLSQAYPLFYYLNYGVLSTPSSRARRIVFIRAISRLILFN